MVEYFLSLPENRNLGFDPGLVSEGIYKSLARGKLRDILFRKSGDNSLRMMARVLHEMDRRHIKIPLKIRIMFKNMDSVNRMLAETGLGSLGDQVP